VEPWEKRQTRHTSPSGAAHFGSLTIKVEYIVRGENAMHTTNLRKIDGSIMLAVPPAVLKTLNLQPGAKVNLAVRDGRLVVEPQARPRHSLDELLEQCSPRAPRRKEERQWLNDKSAGHELI
jgi:antitoxin ChpS